MFYHSCVESLLGLCKLRPNNVKQFSLELVNDFDRFVHSGRFKEIFKVLFYTTQTTSKYFTVMKQIFHSL